MARRHPPDPEERRRHTAATRLKRFARHLERHVRGEPVDPTTRSGLPFLKENGGAIVEPHTEQFPAVAPFGPMPPIECIGERLPRDGSFSCNRNGRTALDENDDCDFKCTAFGLVIPILPARCRTRPSPRE